jgi:thiamine pyrophosphokinase
VRAVILSAGMVTDHPRLRHHLGQPDLVICADGGLRHALLLGLEPDLLVGDLDSADPAQVATLQAKGTPVVKVPAEKDLTDTHLALNQALERGATQILLVGATGGRLDHTMANLLILPGLPVGVSVTLVDAHNIVQLLRPGGRLLVRGEPGAYLSLLPLSPEVTGVVVEGVKWPLDGETLRWGESRGVSNQLVEVEAFVAVRTGHLLVIQAWD